MYVRFGEVLNGFLEFCQLWYFANYFLFQEQGNQSINYKWNTYKDILSFPYERMQVFSEF